MRDATVQRIALAEPSSVPAGVYSKKFLEAVGLWAAVAPKVIPTENVRAVLAAVESGNVDAGIVYKTDALISKKVRVAFEVPASRGPAISYPFALVKGAPHEAAARAFLAHLALEGGPADLREVRVHVPGLRAARWTSFRSSGSPSRSRSSPSRSSRAPGLALAFVLARRRLPGQGRSSRRSSRFPS